MWVPIQLVFKKKVYIFGFPYVWDLEFFGFPSGGEWISSAEVENEIMSHPKVAEAAVIAVASEKWMERPMACVVLKEGESLSHEELIEYLTPRMAKWWLPSATQIIDEVPKTSTGKFSKRTLRDSFVDLVVE